MCDDVTFEPLEAIVERLLAGLGKDRGICAPASKQVWNAKERARMTATSGRAPTTPGSGDVAHAAS